MHLNRRGLALLVAGTLLLTGCVTVREVPPSIGDAELQDYLEDRLDAAWLNTRLDGAVERPDSDTATLVDRYRDAATAQRQIACIEGLGSTEWFSGETDNGPILVPNGETQRDPSLQLGWYRCLAAYPTSPSFGVTLSRAQLAYLYDYYQEWVIPCLTLEGYSVLFIPSRADYINSGGIGWIPYYALGPGLSGDDPYADSASPGFFIELADRCGDPFPGLDYGDAYGF